jgi:excisionase family DNA binding protein
MNLSEAPEYLTIPQLADVLQVPVATIYRWRHLGEGPRGIRVSGRHVRFAAPTSRRSYASARTNS